jgi:hypothetical protein
VTPKCTRTSLLLLLLLQGRLRRWQIYEARRQLGNVGWAAAQDGGMGLASPAAGSEWWPCFPLSCHPLCSQPYLHPLLCVCGVSLGKTWMKVCVSSVCHRFAIITSLSSGIFQQRSFEAEMKFCQSFGIR